MTEKHARPAAATVAFFLCAAAAGPAADPAPGPRATLANGVVTAEFEGARLVRLADAAAGRSIDLREESEAIAWSGERLSTEGRRPAETRRSPGSVVFVYEVSGRTVHVAYELRPGWRFLAKRIVLPFPDGAGGQVGAVELLRARLGDAVLDEHRAGGGSRGVFLRLAGGATGPGAPAPRAGAFVLIQNPFMKWERTEDRISASYLPDMEWKAAYGPFESDRACIGLYAMSGVRFPARNLPEWKLAADPARAFDGAPQIDLAEVEAASGCVRAFVLAPPARTIKVHVPWCENDYQVDVGTPEGMAEYKRVIDRAAEMGCEHMLVTPANREVSRLEDNADAWGWENILWLGLGQKIRKGEWDPEKDAIPRSVGELLDHMKARGIRPVAYVYPTLGWKQDPEWTKWCDGKTGGYVGVDTGVRSFQDWFIAKLVAFAGKTGASGFCFDHWWIAYDRASSKYAQWSGCRRILEELRRRIPDVVIDGRQQYQWFGPWTWLGGSYPHPTTNDEQPGSFENFPDLHFDRVSADRQRWAAWWYRMEQFAPVELIPGYMTHQTQRVDGKGVMRRDRFRPRDWDRLGWRYSVISSIGTAPFNDVLDCIPARDPDEFRLFAPADAAWIRGWLAWTDENIAVLRRLRPIIGPPAIGRADGTAAIDGDRGFVFLFNPNYRALDADFALDGTIGLDRGDRFVLRELYPVEGRRLGRPGGGPWSRGDRMSLRLKGPVAMALEVEPADSVPRPALLGAPGRVESAGGELKLTGVRGEEGTEAELSVLLPPGTGEIRSATANGVAVTVARAGDVASLRVRFAGVRVERCPAVETPSHFVRGGTYRAELRVPARVLDQLKARKAEWPVPFDDEDLLATWLGSDRLLLFVHIADPQDTWTVSARIDGKPVVVRKAYGAVYADARERTFLGFYADISSIVPDVPHAVEVDLPVLAPGQFQGLFLENVEPSLTEEIAR